LATLPLSFEPNHGQTYRQVAFVARTSGALLFLTAQDAVLSLAQPHTGLQSPFLPPPARSVAISSGRRTSRGLSAPSASTRRSQSHHPIPSLSLTY
jgi:hypothetical protein